MLITFEGIEGSGKSTQIKKVSEYFSSKNIPHIATKEPGGTEIGKKIREILLDPASKIDSEVELMFYAADRKQHIKEVILPAIAEGKIVLCDRFIDSTIAYQGYGRGISKELVVKYIDLATDGLKPDLTIVYDLPVEVGLERARKRATLDRFESLGVEFHNRVRKGFLELAFDIDSIAVVNAHLPLDDVYKNTLAEIFWSYPDLK